MVYRPSSLQLLVLTFILMETIGSYVQKQKHSDGKDRGDRSADDDENNENSAPKTLPREPTKKSYTRPLTTDDHGKHSKFSLAIVI
jgi:hypothetical protein